MIPQASLPRTIRFGAGSWFTLSMMIADIAHARLREALGRHADYSRSRLPGPRAPACGSRCARVSICRGPAGVTYFVGARQGPRVSPGAHPSRARGRAQASGLKLAFGEADEKEG